MIGTILLTALGPILWGSTFITFTETLPIDHPLTVGALRALPAGLMLMALGTGLPSRRALPMVTLIALANITIFLPMLFIGAALLPGGVASTLNAAQPLFAAVWAWPVLSRRPALLQIGVALLGLAGVGVLVLDPSAGLNALGVLISLAGAACMGMGTVLIERAGPLGSPLQLTAWQLTIGGMLLLPVALAVEGAPPAPDMTMALGALHLILPGTALSYLLWVRGIGRLGADAAFLHLLAPVVATALGAAWLGEWLSPLQWLGIAMVLTATAGAMAHARHRRRITARG